ncbi:8-oxoguanine deaminase [Kaistia geumhonensis]|uniref:8-oxoguanine deaminase n=1 Tax=Kaistia geumhonensis TaxID=410839 RepID=A0ABU0M974_9HYPH|nr:8-oxoguanine deaminase [Kaistia geumhonensis]MCX5480785.1 8-oxoguanine deaminase [Kaistia geumhonensis]MDQ0517511.1 8-oxoguanine deaminase [Kaistia geumhonensis]
MTDREAETGRLWIRDPIATLGEGAERGVVVEDGRIVELVGKGAEPAHPVMKVFDASRHVVTPGLVNTHHHMFQTMTRAHPAAINKSLWPWIASIYPVWTRHVNAENFRLAARLAMTELMMSGCTCASDHHYLFPRGLEHAMDIEAEEAAALGLRMTLTRGALDLTGAEDSQALAPDGAVQDDDIILADCERIAARYHDRSDGAMTRVALAPNAPFDVTKRLMRETAALAEKHDLGLHTHLVETAREAAFAREVHGMTAADYLEENGWLSSRVWLAHGIHFDDGEVAKLGRHGVGICHCPTSNMVLASGICRTREFEAAGSPVGLGVDGSASNDNSNLMEAVRHALMIGRLRYGAEGITDRDALRFATEGSARCLGRDDIGAIAVGKQADLAFWTLDELRFSGSGDPIAALVLCGAHAADRVMVKGDWRIVDGVPPGMDLEKLRHEHHQASRAFLENF